MTLFYASNIMQQPVTGEHLKTMSVYGPIYRTVIALATFAILFSGCNIV